MPDTFAEYNVTLHDIKRHSGGPLGKSQMLKNIHEVSLSSKFKSFNISTQQKDKMDVRLKNARKMVQIRKKQPFNPF